ncbi:unnamed protein product, partial [marine sediment metagenome]
IVLKGSTITSRQYPFSLSPEKFRHHIRNPEIIDPLSSYYRRGQLSGSGTIYIYLERGPRGSSEDSRERVSNVLSIYATFDPKRVLD